MQIKEMFQKPIDREIQGVIIVGQGEETNVAQELEEYVVTRELQKHFADFFEAYKKGITGTIILGDRYQRIFTALPEHFTLTDYDIHITASTDVIQELENLKAMIPELIKSQLLTPDIIFEAMTAKSLTDLKYKVQKAMKIQKEENNQLQQLGQ
jgi:hypothetical protein